MLLAITSLGISENELWICPVCGSEGLTSRFCSDCGTEKPASTSTAEALATGTSPASNQAVDKSGMGISDGLKSGDVIAFGHYEQDNNLTNGPEPIEWIVLDVGEGKALLLSKYGLDNRPYHNEYASITWENCTLRQWLNNEFLNVTQSVGTRRHSLDRIVTKLKETSEVMIHSIVLFMNLRKKLRLLLHSFFSWFEKRIQNLLEITEMALA